MTTLVEGLSQRARALSPEDRARLVEDLVASLEAESDAAAWETEVQRRAEQVKSGTAKLVSAEDVHAETSSLYRSKRPGVAPKDSSSPSRRSIASQAAPTSGTAAVP